MRTGGGADVERLENFGRSAGLSPEEDALIIGGDDDDIDDTLPADLWFRTRRRRVPPAGRG